MPSAQGCNRPWLFAAVLFFGGRASTCANAPFSVAIVALAMLVNALAPSADAAPVDGSRISAHVLDIANGVPVQGLNISAFRWSDATEQWMLLAVTSTNSKGRVENTHGGLTLDVGLFKLQFETEAYFTKLNQDTFYPYVEVVFKVVSASQSYHIPLTLSNYGYSTYKGQ